MSQMEMIASLRAELAATAELARLRSDKAMLLEVLEQIRDGKKPVVKGTWGHHVATPQDLASAAIAAAKVV
jgi:hypothetical protein